MNTKLKPRIFSAHAVMFPAIDCACPKSAPSTAAKIALAVLSIDEASGAACAHARFTVKPSAPTTANRDAANALGKATTFCKPDCFQRNTLT